MTATVHCNFELYGEHWCFDMIKHGSMSLLWSYTVIALFDEMRHVCIRVKGVMRGVQTDMHGA